jgi:hypothetical protein
LGVFFLVFIKSLASCSIERAGGFFVSAIKLVSLY